MIFSLVASSRQWRKRSLEFCVRWKRQRGFLGARAFPKHKMYSSRAKRVGDVTWFKNISAFVTKRAASAVAEQRGERAAREFIRGQNWWSSRQRAHTGKVGETKDFLTRRKISYFRPNKPSLHGSLIIMTHKTADDRFCLFYFDAHGCTFTVPFVQIHFYKVLWLFISCKHNIHRPSSVIKNLYQRFDN